MGFDPCLDAKKKKDMLSEYNEVSVKFQLEDMNDNFLPLDLCQVLKCGFRLLYEDGIHHFDLIMLGFSRFHPLDGVMEGMFYTMFCQSY